MSLKEIAAAVKYSKYKIRRNLSTLVTYGIFGKHGDTYYDIAMVKQYGGDTQQIGEATENIEVSDIFLRHANGTGQRHGFSIGENVLDGTGQRHGDGTGKSDLDVVPEPLGGKNAFAQSSRVTTTTVSVPNPPNKGGDSTQKPNPSEPISLREAQPDSFECRIQQTSEPNWNGAKNNDQNGFGTVAALESEEFWRKMESMFPGIDAKHVIAKYRDFYPPEQQSLAGAEAWCRNESGFDQPSRKRKKSKTDLDSPEKAEARRIAIDKEAAVVLIRPQTSKYAVELQLSSIFPEAPEVQRKLISEAAIELGFIVKIGGKEDWRFCGRDYAEPAPT